MSDSNSSSSSVRDSSVVQEKSKDSKDSNVVEGNSDYETYPYDEQIKSKLKSKQQQQQVMMMNKIIKQI